jgi:4-hydroxybenzoate polyprenyltransferase
MEESRYNFLALIGIVLVLIVVFFLGTEYGLYPIIYITPIILVMAGFLWRYIYNEEEKRMKELGNPLPKRFDVASKVYGMAFVVIIFFVVLLWFGSCTNGCTNRNPDVPKDVEMKYRIWRDNNP